MNGANFVYNTSWTTRLARDFYVALSLCLYVSLFLFLSMSLYLCLYLYQTSPHLKYACLLTCLSLLPPPSLFPDKKFPAVGDHFWLDKLFYYIEDNISLWKLFTVNICQIKCSCLFFSWYKMAAPGKGGDIILNPVQTTVAGKNLVCWNNNVLLHNSTIFCRYYRC